MARDIRFENNVRSAYLELDGNEYPLVLESLMIRDGIHSLGGWRILELYFRTDYGVCHLEVDYIGMHQIKNYYILNLRNGNELKIRLEFNQ